MFAKPLSHTIGFSDLPHIRSWEDAAAIYESHPTVDKWGYAHSRILSVRKTSKGLRPSKSKTCSSLILSKRGEDYVIGQSSTGSDLVAYHKDGGFTIINSWGDWSFHDLMQYRFWPSALARSLIHVQLDRAGLGYSLHPKYVAPYASVTIPQPHLWPAAVGNDPHEYIRARIAEVRDSDRSLFFPLMRTTTVRFSPSPTTEGEWVVEGLPVAGKRRLTLAAKRAVRPFKACWAWAEAYGRMSGWGEVTKPLFVARLAELDPRRGGSGWYGDAYNWLREQDPAGVASPEHPVWEVLGLAARSACDPTSYYFSSRFRGTPEDLADLACDTAYRNHFRNWAKSWAAIVQSRTPDGWAMTPITPDGQLRVQNYWHSPVAKVDFLAL